VDELSNELAREQKSRAADRRAAVAEKETMLLEWAVTEQQYKEEVEVATQQLAGAQDDFNREAQVADIVNQRSKVGGLLTPSYAVLPPVVHVDSRRGNFPLLAAPVIL